MSTDDILADLMSRFAPGWPATLSVPDGWLPHLATLHTELAAIDPTGEVYTVAQVKEKFGGLRFYLAGTEPTCCVRWGNANPVPDDTCDEVQQRWEQAAVEHEHSAEHTTTVADHEARRARLDELIAAAEKASYTWDW